MIYVFFATIRFAQTAAFSSNRIIPTDCYYL